MIEQLHATKLRLARESATGSGSPSGDWITPPTTAAAVSRNFMQTAQRQDVFRQLNARKVVAEAWIMRSSHEVGLEWLEWVLLPHLTARGAGVYTLDPEAEGPTYVLDTETEQGHRAKFSGLKLNEVQLIFEEGRTVRVDLQWIGLRRTVPATALPGAATAPTGGLVANFLSQAAMTTGAWATDPRADQPVNAHGAQIFLQRDIAAADFGPDGIPEAHNRAAWRLVGECYMPETPGITDTAFSDDWQGKVALWIGEGAKHLRVNNAQGYVTDDDLKGYDFRVRRLVFEGKSDDRRSICEFRA
jgi:hypothetical protein